MKAAIEVKIGFGILYVVTMSVLLNVCLWCMNQPSNIYLTLGAVCGMVIILSNVFILRKYITSKMKESDSES